MLVFPRKLNPLSAHLFTSVGLRFAGKKTGARFIRSPFVGGASYILIRLLTISE